MTIEIPMLEYESTIEFAWWLFVLFCIALGYHWTFIRRRWKHREIWRNL